MKIKRTTFDNLIYGTLVLIIIFTILSLINVTIFGFCTLITALVQGMVLVMFGLDENNIKDKGDVSRETK